MKKVFKSLEKDFFRPHFFLSCSVFFFPQFGVTSKWPPSIKSAVGLWRAGFEGAWLRERHSFWSQKKPCGKEDGVILVAQFRANYREL